MEKGNAVSRRRQPNDWPDLTLKKPDLIAISFGALVPRLRDQLRAYPRIGAVELSRWQMCADAITVLSVRGILPPVVVETARRKLMRAIAKECRRQLLQDARRRRRLSSRLTA